MLFALIFDEMNGFSAKTGSIVPPGRGYFPHDTRHFVPGFYRAVPLGHSILLAVSESTRGGPNNRLEAYFTMRSGLLSDIPRSSCRVFNAPRTTEV
jgi:hypothetical protein